MIIPYLTLYKAELINRIADGLSQRYVREMKSNHKNDLTNMRFSVRFNDDKAFDESISTLLSLLLYPINLPRKETCSMSH